MYTTLPESVVDLDEILYQSVVDEEFRAQLLADPDRFGLGGFDGALPAPVEPQDQALLDLASGSYYIVACGATCSFGPLTIVCDGTTK